MFISETDIKCINIRIVNKKKRVIFKEKYLYFNERAEREDDAIFLSYVMESFINYKGYSNIDINIFEDSITITCYYNKLFGKNGYTKTIDAYLKLMADIEKYYNKYLELIENNL